MNASVSQIYELPELHKEEFPLRPVVSFFFSPSYLLAKFRDHGFKQITCFNSPLSIKNSVELVSDLAHNPSPPPRSTLVSFDVKCLFFHMPLSPIRTCMEELLKEATFPMVSLMSLLSYFRVTSPLTSANSMNWYIAFRLTSDGEIFSCILIYLRTTPPPLIY